MGAFGGLFHRARFVFYQAHPRNEVQMRYTLAILALCFAALSCSPPTRAALQALPTASATPSPQPSPSPTPTMAPSPTATPAPFCIVSGGAVFLRALPMRRSAALGVANLGERLAILPTPQAGDWLPVASGELRAWIYSDYCEVQR